MKATKTQARNMIHLHNAIQSYADGLNTGLHAHLTMHTIKDELKLACKRAGIQIEFTDGTLYAHAFEVEAS